MAIIGTIFLIIIGFVVLGLLGWIAKGFSWGVGFLGDGVRNFFGCFMTSIFWIVLLLMLIMVI